MSNVQIKSYAMLRGVKLYQIAEKLRISEATMSRMMRKELAPEKRQEIMQIIDQLSEGTRHD